jgi:hypothetical protein
VTTLEEFSPKIAMLVDVIQCSRRQALRIQRSTSPGYGVRARAIMKVMTDHRQDFARGPSAAWKSVAVISGSNEGRLWSQAFNERPTAAALTCRS